MFWNKKKGEKRNLPDLPATPMAAPSMRDFHKITPEINKTIPEIKEDEEEIHGLPSFPDSPMKKGFSQTAIKDAVETEDIKEDLPVLPLMPEKLDSKEFSNQGETRMPSIQQRKSRLMEEEWKPKPLQEAPPERIMRNKPIFVRMDKFQDAKESLEIVEQKLGDIDNLLRTIKEAKEREDQELSSWEKEIESIKSRIESVNATIFENSYSG